MENEMTFYEFYNKKSKSLFNIAEAYFLYFNDGQSNSHYSKEVTAEDYLNFLTLELYRQKFRISSCELSKILLKPLEDASASKIQTNGEEETKKISTSCVKSLVKYPNRGSWREDKNFEELLQLSLNQILSEDVKHVLDELSEHGMLHIARSIVDAKRLEAFQNHLKNEKKKMN